MKKKILSGLLAVAMVFTMLPTAAFATEGITPLGASRVECHATHDEDCGYKEAVEGADCSHKNDDGTYSCASDTVSDNTATPGDADKSACTHEDDCGYVEVVEGADCTHSCEICKPLDSGSADKQPAQEQCSCGVLCTEDKINADCTVCGANSADLTNCKGEDGKNAVAKRTYEQVAELFTALPAASVVNRETTEEEKDAIIAQLTEAMEAFEVLTADEQALFMKEHLELYKAAMALNDAITGATPKPMAEDVPLPPFVEGTNKRYKSGETVAVDQLKKGDRVEVGVTITDISPSVGLIAFDCYEIYTNNATDFTVGPYGEVFLPQQLKNSYENKNEDFLESIPVTTRTEWILYLIPEIDGNNVYAFVSPDRMVKTEYDVTVVKSELTDATALFEIVLNSANKPCEGDSFKVADFDTLKVTITPDDGGNFGTAPTVTVGSTASVGAMTKVDGSEAYTCEITSFTGNTTITVSGTAGASTTPVTITGLTGVDATYDGNSHDGYNGTPVYDPTGFTGALECTYYQGTGTSGTNLGATAPANAGTYTVVAAIPAGDSTYSGKHADITFTIAPKSVSATLASGSVTKMYDGTTAAGTGAITLTASDILAADSGVTVTAGTIPAYSASAVGNAYSLSVPITLTGDTNSNYTLTNSTVAVTGSITAKPVALTDGTMEITKKYNGTISAGTASGALSSTDFVSGDNVAVSVTNVGNYVDATVGTGKPVDLTVALTGPAAGNYSLSNTTYSFTKAEITKATPNVTVTAVKKTDSFLRSIIGSKDDTFIITTTVTGVGSDKPAGTVQLKANGTNIGSLITLNNGVATYEWVQPAASTYTITAEFTATADTNYKNASDYAKSAGETELYRNSRQENIACKGAIEQAIHDNFDGSHLNPDGVQTVFADFGIDRVQLVLANTLQNKDYDGRFSRDNKDWAQAFLIPTDKDALGYNRKLAWVVDSHPAVLDGFIKQVRRSISTLMQQPEKPSIKAQLATPPVHGDAPAAKTKEREVR